MNAWIEHSFNMIATEQVHTNFFAFFFFLQMVKEEIEGK